MAAGSNIEAPLPEADDQSVVSSSQFPLVFQCGGCNVIVGDSLAWVCSNEALRSLTLSSVSSNVRLGKKLQMSTEGPDLGSSYFLLKCGQCSKELGRRYISTNRDLDELREYFTLFVENCNSYQTGSQEQPADITTLKDDRRYINAQLKHIQTVMLRMNERLTGLEQALKMDEMQNQTNISDKTGRSELSQINSSMDRVTHSIKKRRISATAGDTSDSSECTSSRKRRGRVF